VQVAEGGKGIEEDKTGTEPDGGGGGVSAKGGCGDYRGSGELCRCRRSTQCHIVSM